jgi:hypothetical protein
MAPPPVEVDATCMRTVVAEREFGQLVKMRCSVEALVTTMSTTIACGRHAHSLQVTATPTRKWTALCGQDAALSEQTGISTKGMFCPKSLTLCMDCYRGHAIGRLGPSFCNLNDSKIPDRATALCRTRLDEESHGRLYIQIFLS